MKTEEAVAYYGGTKKLADALGVWPQVIYAWGERPPMSRQYELEVKTEGVLRADRTEKEIEEARLDAACQAALGPCFK